MAVYNEADFVMQGREVKDPEIAKDGLKLYYDVKGKKNSDVHKNKLLDMSGQGKDGVLSGFDYDGGPSGYDGDNGLVFDGVDDTLKMPELNGIDANNFTYQLNNNILAFTEDKVKTVRNGNVEVGGRNYWAIAKEPWYNRLTHQGGGVFTNTATSSSFAIFSMDKLEVPVGDTYTASFEINVSDDAIEFSNDVFYVNGVTPSVRHNRPILVKDEWVKVYATFNYTVENTSKVHIYIINIPAPDTLQIRNFKLEKGTKATPWTPAPEDLLETTELKGNILGDMEDIVDASPRDRQSGKEIFTEHADDGHVEVEVDGQSYQHAGSGKNLFIPQSIWVEDTVDGEEVWRFKNYFVENIFKENTQYTFRARAMYSAGYVVSLRFNYTDGTYSQSTYFFDRMGNRSLTSDAGKTVKSAGFNQMISDNDAYHIIAVKDSIQLEEGSTATEYEPPAPTPDYPVEIHSLNDFDVVSSVEKLSEGQLQEYDYGVEYENVDKVNLSLSEPLRSVGDIKDRLFRDSDGLWKVERNIEPIHPEDGTRTIEETYGVLDNPIYEVLSQELQDRLNNLHSFQDSNYVYTVQNTANLHRERLKPTLHATFNSKDYLKETRTLTNLLIWARELTDEELIHHNQLFLNRFNLPSDRVIGGLIEQTLNLLHGRMVGHSLEQNYTINI